MYVVGVRSKDADNWAANSGGLYLFNDQSDGSWMNSAAAERVVEGAGRYFVPLPFGVGTVTWPTSQATYEGRTYYCGGFTYNLVLDEHHRLLKQGIRAPDAPPTISGATGTTKVAYTSWYDELTGERSSLSMGTTIGDAVPRTWTLQSRPPDDVFVSDGSMESGGSYIEPVTPAARSFLFRPGDRICFVDASADPSYLGVHEIGTGRLTTDEVGDLPTGSPSTLQGLPVSRCSHCELWISTGGGLPQLVMRVAIGVTTVTESVADANLGESWIGAFERFPRCTMNIIWHDRQLMAGDPDNPDTVYMSETFYPERYAGLSFKTRGGEPVTGLLALRDFCLVFSRTRMYILEGYSEDDFELKPAEQSLGSIGHECNKVVHGAAYIWTDKGPYAYNGAWHPLSPENEFTTPSVSDSIWVRGVVDPDSNTYSVVSDSLNLFDRYNSLVLPNDPLNNIFSNILVFDYTTVQPETGGGMGTARLSLDAQSIFNYSNATTPGYSETVMHHHYLSNKWGIGKLYTVSYDYAALDPVTNTPLENSFSVFPHWKLNEVNGITQVGLLSDYDTGLWIKTGWNSFQDPGGSFVEGKTFSRLWIDAPSGLAASLWTGAGSDALGIGNLPITLPAQTGVTIRPSEVQFLVLEGMTGRGLVLIYNMPSLRGGGSFRGFGGLYT